MSKVHYYIKNMVCDRCKQAVAAAFRQMEILPLSVDLGVVTLNERLSTQQEYELEFRLNDMGFELIQDRKTRMVEEVKIMIIKLIYQDNNQMTTKLSDYLQQNLHQEYSSISKLFSEYTGMTIEHYYIEQKVERVKELLTYDQMTLTDIAMMMNYSSVAYLSSQFKSVTGLTPSEFKQSRIVDRRSLDQI